MSSYHVVSPPEAEIEMGMLRNVSDVASGSCSDNSEEVGDTVEHRTFGRFKRLALGTVAASAVLALGAHTVSGNISRKEGRPARVATEFEPMMKDELGGPMAPPPEWLKDSIAASTTGAPDWLKDAIAASTTAAPERLKDSIAAPTTAAPELQVTPASGPVPAVPAPTTSAAAPPAAAAVAAAAAPGAAQAAAVSGIPTPRYDWDSKQAFPLGVDARGVYSKPFEDVHDGNVCGDDEELLMGLCYTKCAILLGKPEAHRFSAFSCCPTNDCHGNVFKMKTASVVPCSGYDRSSADGGKACPHVPGACLTDEEQFLGKCYETCDKLTDGKYKKRVGPMSCCDTEGIGCLNPHEDKSSSSFSVGGGKGDKDPSTPSAPHFPTAKFTEGK